jgi:DNA-binding transcriptional regulator YiaG
MKSLQERAEHIRHKIQIAIPTLDGLRVAYRVPVVVPALRDPKDGEIYLEGDAQEIIDRIKARHMGLLSAEEIRDLRKRLGLSQRAISQLLQMGSKTYTRWESGRDHPSRSLNILLRALRDDRLDPPYLLSLQPALESSDRGWEHTIETKPARALAESPALEPKHRRRRAG